MAHVYIWVKKHVVSPEVNQMVRNGSFGSLGRISKKKFMGMVENENLKGRFLRIFWYFGNILDVELIFIWKRAR